VHPTNPRVSPELGFPIGGAANRRPPLPALGPAPLDAPELVLEVADPGELVAALDQAITYLTGVNDLSVAITQDGVREELTLVALTITHKDGTPGATVLSAADGSSRTASGYSLLGLNPTEVVYRLAGDDRRFRRYLGDVRLLLERDRDTLTTAELARLHALQAPAMIVVGFRPDPGSDTNIARAVFSRLGAVHVDPPATWTEAAKLDSRLDAAVEACVRRRKISLATAEYFLGVSTPEQAERAGHNSDLGVRSTELLKFFAARRNAYAVHEGLRALATRPTAFALGDRLDIAAEAAIRPYRSSAEVTHTTVSRARLALQAAFRMDELTDQDSWSVRPDRTPDGLRDGALVELANGGPGPDALELLGRAVFWMTRFNTIIKSTRGGDPYRREMVGVLRVMLASPHGVHQLYQAVVDGSVGLAPRQVRPDGSLVVRPDGTHTAADDTWIRATYRETPVAKDGGTGPALTPEADLNQRREQFRSLMDQVKEELAGLEKPQSPRGGPLIREVGISPIVSDQITKVCGEVQGAMVHWAHIWREQAGSNDAPEAVTIPDDDVEAEAEGATS
jgi:hypothetical protein